MKLGMFYLVHIDVPGTLAYTLGKRPSLCDSNDSWDQGTEWNSWIRNIQV